MFALSTRSDSQQHEIDGEKFTMAPERAHETNYREKSKFHVGNRSRGGGFPPEDLQGRMYPSREKAIRTGSDTALAKKEASVGRKGERPPYNRITDAPSSSRTWHRHKARTHKGPLGEVFVLPSEPRAQPGREEHSQRAPCGLPLLLLYNAYVPPAGE